MLKNLEIYIASIQGTIFSYTFSLETGEFSRNFTLHDHIGKIKSLHLSKKDNLLLTSGEDENIKFYNTKKKEKMSNIFGIKGICNKILSTEKFIISGLETGEVCFIGKTDYAIYHKLKVFKNSIIDINLHPSNKILACLSKTGRFSVWDLSTLLCIFHKKIKVKIESIKFFNQNLLLLVAQNNFFVFDLKTMEILKEIKVDGKINDMRCLKFKDKNYLFLALDNGFVSFFNEEILLKENSEEEDNNNKNFWVKFKAYDYRIKKLDLVDNFLVTISTEGDISIWDVEELMNLENINDELFLENFAPVYEFKIESRFVHLKIKGIYESDLIEVKPKKVKKIKHQVKKEVVKQNKKIRKMKNKKKNKKNQKRKNN